MWNIVTQCKIHTIRLLLESEITSLWKYWQNISDLKIKKKSQPGTKLAELYNMSSINVTFVILNWKLTVMQQWSVGLKWAQMNTDVPSARAQCSVQHGCCCFFKCYSTRNSENISKFTIHDSMYNSVRNQSDDTIHSTLTGKVLCVYFFQ